MISLGRDDPAREDAVAIVDNWRGCHAYPLQVIKMTLLHRAIKINNQALIAQRLKRLSSIELKLLHNSNMKLSQVQDIGGCRAVLNNVKEVEQLVEVYKDFHAKSGAKGSKDELRTRSFWDGSEAFDYIKNPKADGYRSVHLIFRFQSPSAEKKIFNGQRIEIQIRSRLQHAWATAVETAQLFTGQALKARIKDASENWLRFFALSSAAFARREKTKGVPNTPENARDLVTELSRIESHEQIITSLLSWNNTIHYIEESRSRDAHTFLMVLDPTKRTLQVSQFKKNQIMEAQERYRLTEKETEGDSRIQAVLVSVESVNDLRKAYPNYYVDTKEFVKALQRELRVKK